MTLPKPPYSYEMALAQQPKGFQFVCPGCKETFTVFPNGQPSKYVCWCGSTKQFTGRETSAATI